MARNVPDHYAVLHVPRTATQREISRAYRSLMRMHHPDLENPTAVPAELQLIMQAFEVLRDPKRRQAYDRESLQEERRAAEPPARAGPPAQDRSNTGQRVNEAAGGRKVPVRRQGPSQDVPVRHIRHEDPPLRATPVRWESGPWATIRYDSRGERRR
jgi:DnaJ-class molecular chaperone